MKTKDTAMKCSSAPSINARTASRRSRARSLSSKALSIVMSAILVIGLSPLTKVSSADADGADAASASVSQLPSGTYWNNGDVSFTTIDSSNTFTSSVWDDYRDNGYDGTGNALGIAGSFHLVAFNELNTASSHVYGNMLAKTVTGNQDYGTDGRFDDLYGHSTLSYFQNYQGTHSRFGATAFAKQAIVFGSNTDTFSLFSVNENQHDIINYGNTKTSQMKVDFPKTIAQDLDSSTTPFINLDDVKAEAEALSNTLAARSSLGGATYDFSDMNNKKITYTKGSGCAYVELSLSDLTSNGNPIRINDVPTDGTGALVINVDCKGASAAMPDQIILNAADGKQAGLGEVDADMGYVLWNFYNASGATITGAGMVSSILAPGATLNLKGNACGTFIADNITVTGETHTRPFHGKFHEDDTTSVSVEKQWLDSKGEAEVDIAHDAITAELWYADESGNATTAVTDASGKAMTVQLSAANNWKYTWSDLPTKSGGQTLHYTVKESGLGASDAASYDSSVAGDGNAFTITNQHKAEVSVSASKVWKDNDNIDKLRPTSVTLSIVRQVEGGAWTSTGETLVLTAGNEWTATKTGLPATDASGKAYTYSLQEAEVAGYTGSITFDSSTDEFGNASYTFTVTNTHQASKVSATVTKAWNDDDDRDGIRAESVDVNLMRSVNGGAKQIIGTKTLSAANGWTATFEDLPTWGDEGTYAYSIDEVSVAGYAAKVATSQDSAGNYTFALTNTHEVAKTSVGVHKVWNDANDQDGLRPESVQVQLLADGEVVAGSEKTLSAANGWSATWSDLAKNAAGKAIDYTVAEVGDVEGYTPSVTGGFVESKGAFAYTLTNTHAAATTEVDVQKAWLASDGTPEGGDHDAITVQLYRSIDGAAAEPMAGYVVELSAANGWKASWKDLPAKQGGKDVAYSVAEVGVPAGYTAKVTTGDAPNSFTITNTADKKTQVSVVKEWIDADNADGVRPEAVTAQLCTVDAQGTPVPLSGKTAVLSAANDWSYTWEGLDANDAAGNPIAYSVQEAVVPAGYEGDVSGGKLADGTFAFTMTNTHERALTAVDVTKVWNDANDADGLRPESVTAQLYVVDAQGAATPVADKAAVLSVDNNWTASWTDLPAKEAGAAIKYTVREVEVPAGYAVDIKGVANQDGSFAFTMTNTHEQEEVELSLAGYSVRSISDAAPEAGKVCYVDPKVNKVLTGRALADGEFAFQLIDDATGAVVSSATNNAAGMVDFDKANNVSGDDMNPCCLQFTAAGTYTYTVREDPSKEKDPTIDYSTEVVTFETTIEEVKAEDGTTSLKEAESKYIVYASAADRAAGVAGKVIAVTGSDTVHPTITNSVKAIELGLTKFNADSSETLPGAVYGLYRAASVAGVDSADDVLVAKATSDAEGHMTFVTTDSTEVISTDTDYWFKEISAPAGYKLSQEPTQKFQIKLVGEGNDVKYQLAYADGSTSKEYSIGTVIEFGDGAGVTDEALSVKVNKVDSARQGLAGAKLGVRLADGTEALDEWTSNGAGHVLTGLVAGKEYVLYESEVPEGFAKAADVTFTVDDSGAITLVDNAFAKVNDKDVLNAYAAGSDVSMVDYKKNETVEQKVVQREQAKTTSNTATKSSTVKTGDSLPVAAIAVVAVVCLAIAVAAAFAARRRKGK